MFMTRLSYQEREGMAVELGLQAAKPLTTVQDCVSTFVSVKPLDIFKETSGEFSSCGCGDKKLYFWREVGTPPAVFVVFLAERVRFLTFTEWFLSLNVTRSSAQHCEEIKREVPT